MSEPASAADGERRPYHHGDLRAALLAEAEALLEERGLAGFSLRAVAKRAGVSHAAPAHHFGDARGLLTALAAEGFARLDAAQAAREAGAGDGAARLVASGQGYVAFALERPALFGLMFDAERLDHDDPGLARTAGAAFERLRRNTAGADEGASLARLRAAWGVAHGLATLMIAGNLRDLAAMPPRARDEAVGALLAGLLR